MERLCATGPGDGAQSVFVSKSIDLRPRTLKSRPAHGNLGTRIDYLRANQDPVFLPRSPVLLEACALGRCGVDVRGYSVDVKGCCVDVKGAYLPIYWK
eukprot:3115353-Pyramimonas_sp.AAC.1